MVTALVGAFLLTPAYISYGSNSSSNGPFSTGNIVIAVIFVIVALLIAYYLMQIRKGFQQKKYTGIESIIGKEGTAKTDISMHGWVSIEGQQWQAKSEGEIIPADSEVLITGKEGLILIVKKKE